MLDTNIVFGSDPATRIIRTEKSISLSSRSNSFPSFDIRHSIFDIRYSNHQHPFCPCCHFCPLLPYSPGGYSAALQCRNHPNLRPDALKNLRAKPVELMIPATIPGQ